MTEPRQLVEQRNAPIPRGRQARGERRVAQLLDAAAELYAEQGYARTTTTAVAKRAGASPGTLYQFFSDRKEIAEALAERYQLRLAAICPIDGAAQVARLPIAELLDRIVDPLLGFYLEHPGFKALFGDPEAPAELIASGQHLYMTVLDYVDQIVAGRAPTLPDDERLRCARVMVQVMKAVLPVAVAAVGAERAALVEELKKMLRGYLEPTCDGRG
jgi:AcrR family transcriptional regulator